AGWMPIALWALHRYLMSGSSRALAAFAVAFVLQALSNGYFLYFFSIAVAVVIAVELVWPRLSRARIAGDRALAGCGGLAALAPPRRGEGRRCRRAGAVCVDVHPRPA